MSELFGTGELIFDTFVQMASTLGYENVKMKDIAGMAGIKTASIYSHFKSKRKILECAYNYYTEHLYDNRMSADKIKKMIETASAKKIIDALSYTFESEDRKKYIRMILITKLVYMRLFQDLLANEIFAEANLRNSEYVIDILKHGIDIGRIDGSLDVKTFTDVLIGAKVVMGVRAFAGADYEAAQLGQEKRIMALFVRFLSSFLKPVGQKKPGA